MNKKERRELIFEDAEIIYPNFSGRPGEFNRQGDRNFNIVIHDSEKAEALLEEGWNIKIKTPKVNEGNSYYLLPVAVSYHEEGSGLEFLNPKAYLITGRRKKLLDASTIGCLDRINSETVDVIISGGTPYDRRDGTKGIKAWLSEIYVVARENHIADKYADENYD